MEAEVTLIIQREGYVDPSDLDELVQTLFLGSAHVALANGLTCKCEYKIVSNQAVPKGA